MRDISNNGQNTSQSIKGLLVSLNTSPISRGKGISTFEGVCTMLYGEQEESTVRQCELQLSAIKLPVYSPPAATGMY